MNFNFEMENNFENLLLSKMHNIFIINLTKFGRRDVNESFFFLFFPFKFEVECHFFKSQWKKV